MDLNAHIIEDLRDKVGFGAEVDFMNLCKGVPLVFKGSIRRIGVETITFEVHEPDSICLEWDDTTMILHDIFISGIRGKIIDFNPLEGWVELGEFCYTDRGFGERATVRVEPDEPIEVQIGLGDSNFPGSIVDVSLNGFGLRTEASGASAIGQGTSITLQFQLMGKALNMPCRVLGIFQRTDHLRLAVSFATDAPGHAVVTRYLSRRRAQIRTEIQTAYKKATGQED